MNALFAREHFRKENVAERLGWRDQLRIGLGPSGLVVAGYRRGLRSGLVAKEMIPIEPPADDARPWQAAVDALPAALALCGGGRPHVTVVVSNHFVRYALLPWNAALKSEAEWLALARHRFLSVHGPAAEDWVVRVAETGHEAARLASAIDRALLAALEEKIAGPASLASVQPYLMAAFNRVRPMLGNASRWLAIEEPGRVTLALVESGVWRAIRSRRTDEHRRLTLSEVIERENALLALEAPCTQVFIETHFTVDPALHGTCELCDVTPGAAAGDRELAMALE